MNDIFDEYYYQIYNWFLKKANNKEDAEDLTNNVFLAIFSYFKKNIKVDKLENLIWKIAYNIWCNKAKNYIKEKQNVSLLDNIGYEEPMLDKIIYKEIIDNLDNIGLTLKEKNIFNMYYLNDLSIKEISEKLNTKEGNVKYFLYSARKKIKEEYDEQFR